MLRPLQDLIVLAMELQTKMTDLNVTLSAVTHGSDAFSPKVGIPKQEGPVQCCRILLQCLIAMDLLEAIGANSTPAILHFIVVNIHASSKNF